MSIPIQGITAALPAATPAAAPDAPVQGASFGDMLVGALSEAGQAERSADAEAQRFADGDPSLGIHEVMIAAERAEIGVRYAVTLVNRAIEAYRELMNTPV